MKVVGISGSLRRGSHNTTLLRAAAELLPPPMELELFDGLKAVPPYDEDDDVAGGPEGAGELRAAIEDADAILIATPEYNSSVTRPSPSTAGSPIRSCASDTPRSSTSSSPSPSSSAPPLASPPERQFSIRLPVGAGPRTGSPPPPPRH